VLKSVPDEETTVASKTTCTKRSDHYACTTHFASPPGQPDLKTDVACRSNRARCTTEPKS